MATRWVRAGLALAAVWLATDARAQVTSEVVIPSWTQSKVLFVDTATGQLAASMTLGGQPYNVAVTPDGRLAVVTQRSSNMISVIDIETRTVITQIAAKGIEPRGVAIDPNGQFAYVTLGRSNLVDVLDLGALAIAKQVATQSYPWGIALTHDGTRAVVVNRMSNSVSVIDLATLTTTAVISNIGTQPVEPIISSDDAMAYVSSSETDTIVPIDLHTLAASVPIPVGDFPVPMALTPDGRDLWVSNTEGTTVSIIDVASQTVIGAVDIGANTGPYGLSISRDGRFAYLGTEGTLQANGSWSGRFYTIDTASRAVLSSIPLGGQDLRQTLTPLMVIPGATSADAMTAASDADLTDAGFGPYIVFRGGTLRASADWPSASPRAISMRPEGGTIDTQSFTIEFDGGSVNTGPLHKIGSGTLRLSGFFGNWATDVTEGTLTLVNATLDRFLTLNGGTLTGTGSIGDLEVPNGIVSPGDGTAVGGMLFVETAKFGPNCVFRADVGPAGTDEILAVATAVSLDNATLQIQSNGFLPKDHQATIIMNAVGQFRDLPEGATVAGQPSGLYRISYTGGPARRDVVLTQIQ